MADVEYVHEKVSIAVECLAAGDGAFEVRMFDAWVSALHVLDSRDATATYSEELNSVLLCCVNHATDGGGTFSPFSDEERRRIGRNLIDVLIETSRLTPGD